MSIFKRIMVKVLNGCLMIFPFFVFTILLYLLITNNVTEPIDFLMLLYICAAVCILGNIGYAIYRTIKLKKLSMKEKPIIDGFNCNVVKKKNNKSGLFMTIFKFELKTILICGIMSLALKYITKAMDMINNRRLECLIGIIFLSIFCYSFNRIIYRHHIKTKCQNCKSNNTIFTSNKEFIRSYTRDVYQNKTNNDYETRTRTESNYNSATDRYDYRDYTEERITASRTDTKVYKDVKFNVYNVYHKCYECGQIYVSKEEEMIGKLSDYSSYMDYGSTSYKNGNWHRV